MLKEHDIVALTADVPEDGLEAGDVGAIVSVAPDGREFTVEFMTSTGKTVAVVPVPYNHVRPVSDQDIKHARRMTTAKA